MITSSACKWMTLSQSLLNAVCKSVYMSQSFVWVDRFQTTKLTCSSQQVPLSPGLMNVVLHLVVRSTSRHQVTLAHRWKKGSVSRISCLAKRQKEQLTFEKIVILVFSVRHRFLLFRRLFCVFNLLEVEQTSGIFSYFETATDHTFTSSFSPSHTKTRPVLTFTTTSAESPSELKSVTLRLLSRI